MIVNKRSLFLLTISYTVILVSIASAFDDTEIHGYHFHTYFFQDNIASRNEALTLRDEIQRQIDTQFLGNCRLNNVNLVPRGPHVVGSYETCCNQTSISPAISWFMQNHGNLSVLLHPLTRWEVLDHTTRSMFLGPRIPLDISALSEDLGDDLDLCLPLPDSNSTSPSIPMFATLVLIFPGIVSLLLLLL